MIKKCRFLLIAVIVFIVLQPLCAFPYRYSGSATDDPLLNVFKDSIAAIKARDRDKVASVISAGGLKDADCSKSKLAICEAYYSGVLCGNVKGYDKKNGTNLDDEILKNFSDLEKLYSYPVNLL